jgi:Mn-dependent DtxR family transcriptional regulator
VKPDLSLHDADQLEEIELYGELVIAASSHDGPLTVAEVDAVLGVKPPSRG